MKHKNSQFKHSPLAFYKTKPNGSIVVVHSEATDFSVINLEDSSAGLWVLMATSKSFAELVDWMCNEYEVERSVAEQDIEEFLNDLLAKQLIESNSL